MVVFHGPNNTVFKSAHNVVGVSELPKFGGVCSTGLDKLLNFFVHMSVILE